MSMKSKMVLVGCAIAASCAAIAPASASVLTFDDLHGTDYFTTNYDGFSFGNNNPQTNAWFWTDQVSSFYKPKSGATFISTDFQLYNSANLYQATLPISSATAFVFDGAFFSGDSSIGYQLLLNGSVVYNSTPSSALTSTPTFIGSGYAGAVDQVVIYGHQGYFALDNFTYHGVAAVPEPATWAMMLVGFGMMGASMRYRRRSTTAAYA